MRLDENDIDLHGFLRAFYSCDKLGRSFVMDNAVQRPIPSYANFSYDKKNYASILKEVLNPLGLKLVQGKWIDAVVVLPPKEPIPPSALPAPFMGALGEQKGGLNNQPDSTGVIPPDEIPPPVSPVREIRRFRAQASGLLRSTARRMGLSYTELLATASPVKGAWRKEHVRDNISVSPMWQISALASDSLGTNDFARVVVFSAYDTAKVIFGGETRRPESTLNYDNGQALTQYSSIFDGLTVEVKGDSWSFLWRGDGSVLEVPGSIGSCASGSSKVKFSGRAGVPFLSSVLFLGYLFSWENKYDDELLITVCLEVLDA